MLKRQLKNSEVSLHNFLFMKIIKKVFLSPFSQFLDCQP